MTDDYADDQAEEYVHSEDEESAAQRWHGELDELTPEERERLTSSISGSLTMFRTALKTNSAFKINVATLLGDQRRMAKSMLGRLGSTPKPSILNIVDYATPKPLAGVVFSRFDPMKMMAENFMSRPRPFIVPTTDFSTQKLLTGVDFSGFGGVASEFNAWLLEQSGVRESIERLNRSMLRQLPANLRDLPTNDLVQVGGIVCDDGIALYGAPRKEIVSELIAAPTCDSRRAILSGRATKISLDCRSLLEACSSDWSQNVAPFAVEAWDSFDSGQAASAQALAASIVDTLLRSLYGGRRAEYTPSRAGAGNPRTVDVLRSLPLREFLAVSPIWQSHQQFWVENGDPIPETFNRNASAHAVSAEQYKPVNAVQSLLYASTLLWFMDHEMARIEAEAVDPASSA